MASEEHVWRDEHIGLEAILVIDDDARGPAVGGTRTRAYPSFAAAREDARQLARAMTIKCALADLPAGGCKIVVREHAKMQREAVFAEIGRRVDAFAGAIRTAGDLGTSDVDVNRMASESGFVHAGSAALSVSAARGVIRCMEATASRRGRDVASLHVAVQGVGDIGAAVARAVCAAGAQVTVADTNEGRLEALLNELPQLAHVDPDTILASQVDVVSPCAVSGALDVAAVTALRAWAVVGAANNILASERAERALADAGVLFVPDVIASAGAVVDGVGELVMGLADRGPLVDRLGHVAREVLERADREGISSTRAAEAIASDRLGRATWLLHRGA